jgi:DNA primase
MLKTLSRQLERPVVTSRRANPTDIAREADGNASDRAEWMILLIYLHRADLRDKICALLDEKDLIFNTPVYRLLWQNILELQPGLARADDLLPALHDRSLSEADGRDEIRSLFNLNEHALETLFRPDEQIERAVARMEKSGLTEYRRYCQEQWHHYLASSPDRERVEFYEREIQQTIEKLIALDPLYQNREGIP